METDSESIFKIIRSSSSSSGKTLKCSFSLSLCVHTCSLKTNKLKQREKKKQTKKTGTTTFSVTFSSFNTANVNREREKKKEEQGGSDDKTVKSLKVNHLWQVYKLK